MGAGRRHTRLFRRHFSCMAPSPYSNGKGHAQEMAQSRIHGKTRSLSYRSRNTTRGHLFTRISEYGGAPVRAHRYCRFDATVKGWEFTSSLWRSLWSSTRRMVSLQRTARLVSGTPTRKRQACWTGPEGPAGHWRRRDVTNRRTHRERRIHGVEDWDQA